MFIQPIQFNNNHLLKKKNNTNKPKINFKGNSQEILCKIGNTLFMEDSTIKLIEPKIFYNGIYDLLQGIQKSKIWRYPNLEERLSQMLQLSSKPQFENKKVLSLIGYGKNSVYTELETGQVVGVSYNNPFYGRSVQNFDLPVEEQGFVGRLYYNVRPVVTEEATLEEVLAVKAQIRKAGFKPTDDFKDYQTHQTCKYKGKPYLLDAECATR